MSGYEMTKSFDSSLVFVWSAQHSQIYPELARMQEDGLISQEAERGPRGRRRYRITPEGEDELRRWLTQTEPRRSDRSDAFLRLFFLWLLTPEEAEAFLQREIDWHTKGLAGYEVIDRGAETGELQFGPWGRLPLELGLRYKRALIDYLEWAVAEVRAGRHAPRSPDC